MNEWYFINPKGKMNQLINAQLLTYDVINTVSVLHFSLYIIVRFDGGKNVKNLLIRVWLFGKFTPGTRVSHNIMTTDKFNQKFCLFYAVLRNLAPVALTPVIYPNISEDQLKAPNDTFSYSNSADSAGP